MIYLFGQLAAFNLVNVHGPLNRFRIVSTASGLPGTFSYPVYQTGKIKNFRAEFRVGAMNRACLRQVAESAPRLFRVCIPGSNRFRPPMSEPRKPPILNDNGGSTLPQLLIGANL